MKRPRRAKKLLNPRLFLFTICLPILGAGCIGAQKIARPLTGPAVVIGDNHPSLAGQFELALDEIELDWGEDPQVTGKAPAPSALEAAGAQLLESAGHRAAFTVSGVTSTAELLKIAADLKTANPGADIRLVLYAQGKPRSEMTRRLLTRQVGLWLKPEGDPMEILSGLALGSVRAVPGTRDGYIVDMPDPFAALDLVHALRAHSRVRTVYPMLAAPTMLREKQERKRQQIAKSLLPYHFPAEAQEFFVQKRIPPGQTALPMEKYLRALETMEHMPHYSTRLGNSFPSLREMGPTEEAAFSLGSWVPLGPGNIGGRTRGLLIDPTNPNIMYAAGVAGGVWKTTNAGNTWTPLTDLLANLAVNSLAMAPLNPSILYAGTGEGYFNGDAVRGAGIFKTTNGGATWTHLASTNNSNFHYVNDIVVSPNNTNRVYAATRTGVWRSVDGGISWARVHNPGINGGCLDLAIRTDQATDSVFASCGTFAQAVVYRNTDAGVTGTWTAVLTESGMGRTSLAIAPSNQNIVYALAASVATGTFNNGLHAVFRSPGGGAAGTWTARVRNTDPTKLNTVLLTNPVFAFFAECGFGSSQFFNQGWYDNVIAVDPLDPNRVWAGGLSRGQ